MLLACENQPTLGRRCLGKPSWSATISMYQEMGTQLRCGLCVDGVSLLCLVLTPAPIPGTGEDRGELPTLGSAFCCCQCPL